MDNCPRSITPQLIAPGTIPSGQLPPANCHQDNDPPDNLPLFQLVHRQLHPMPTAPYTISPKQFPAVSIHPSQLSSLIKLPPTRQVS